MVARAFFHAATKLSDDDEDILPQEDGDEQKLSVYCLFAELFPEHVVSKDLGGLTARSGLTRLQFNKLGYEIYVKEQSRRVPAPRAKPGNPGYGFRRARWRNTLDGAEDQQTMHGTLQAIGLPYARCAHICLRVDQFRKAWDDARRPSRPAGPGRPKARARGKAGSTSPDGVSSAMHAVAPGSYGGFTGFDKLPSPNLFHANPPLGMEMAAGMYPWMMVPQPYSNMAPNGPMAANMAMLPNGLNLMQSMLATGMIPMQIAGNPFAGQGPDNAASELLKELAAKNAIQGSALSNGTDKRKNGRQATLHEQHSAGLDSLGGSGMTTSKEGDNDGQHAGLSEQQAAFLEALTRHGQASSALQNDVLPSAGVKRALEGGNAGGTLNGALKALPKDLITSEPVQLPGMSAPKIDPSSLLPGLNSSVLSVLRATLQDDERSRKRACKIETPCKLETKSEESSNKADLTNLLAR